jgi:mRNA interferase RelE/StbE
MKYKIKISKQFEKDFAKLDSLTQSKILVVLERMQTKPFQKIKKLKSIKIGIFRRRIGDYRLRFDVMKNTIYLYRIRHRKEVYKNL